MEKTLGLLLVLGTNILTAASDFCPYNVTACECKTDVVKCFNLDSIPPLMSDNQNGSITTVLFLRGNIKNVSDNSLPPNLRSITFTSVPVTYISPDAFNSSSTTLRSLQMTDTKYNQVPTALLYVNNLTSLTFSDTQITEWNSTIMRHLGQTVLTLTLKNVGISTWPDFIEYFEFVTNVDLSNNKIESIPKGAFTNQSSLTSLTLSGNQLSKATNLDDALRSVASTLEHLIIGGNMLSSIPPSVGSMTRLSELSLVNNNIQDLTNRIPPHLNILDLSSNNIKTFTNNFFINASSLKSLVTYDNPLNEISDLAFLPLQNLVQLYLYSNKSIPIPVALSSLRNLKTLILESNFHCPCPRNDQLYQWYNSMKNLSIFGYCDGHTNKIESYFHNDTYRWICSGNDKLTYSVHLCSAMLVLFSFSIL